jgi:hypothetical protein
LTLEGVKDDLNETSKAILLELGMLDTYRTLSKDIETQSHRAKKRDPSDPDHRDWTRKMEAGHNGYKAKADRLGEARRARTESSDILQQNKGMAHRRPRRPATSLPWMPTTAKKTGTDDDDPSSDRSITSLTTETYQDYGSLVPGTKAAINDIAHKALDTLLNTELQVVRNKKQALHKIGAKDAEEYLRVFFMEMVGTVQERPTDLVQNVGI